MHIKDASRRNRIPTGHVVVSDVGDASDLAIAIAAGYDPNPDTTCHFGYTVHHHWDSDSATVDLFND